MSGTSANSFGQWERPIFQSMLRGWSKHCPACGEGSIFGRFLKISDQCPRCSEELHHQRADDAPPYFTIMIVGHIIVPLMLWLERGWEPASWVHMVLWLPLTLILTMWILPRVKGALVGLQWAKRMHGFGGYAD